MLPDLSTNQWMDPSSARIGADHLLDLAATFDDDFLEDARWDTLTALDRVPDLQVIVDNSIRSAACPIDGTYDPATQTIRYRKVAATRDRFTLLHELGHHLLALDEAWSLSIGPGLDSVKYGDKVEERIVNQFASRVLIPDASAAAAFAKGVTARAIADLTDEGSASGRACLVRALAEPGERLVMLTDLAGQPEFADSNGSPYSPGTSVRQPALEVAAQRAMESDDGAFVGIGLGEILYRSGGTFSNVRYDVALNGDRLYAVLTALPMVRGVNGATEWRVDCLAGCGNQFTQAESKGLCQDCQEPRCPRCRGCECAADQIRTCAQCYVQLPVSRVEDVCELCE